MLTPASLIHPRDEIVQTIDLIYRFRMTTTSGGNLSIRGVDDEIWITPARVDKGQLGRDDIVCVWPKGKTQGRHPPSSELPFHQAIYAASRDLSAIVHAHPVSLVAFSIAKQVPNMRLFHQSFEVCDDVGFAPYALPGSTQLGQNIATCFANGFRCVVLENHGVVVAGNSLQQAFQRFETLEFTAKTEIMARHLGQPRYLSEEQLAMAVEMERLPTDPHILPASTEEKELRRQLCNFIRRGYQQRLLISTEGTFSARLGDDDFIITPFRADRGHIHVEDLVRVRHGVALTRSHPSRATAIHRAMYQAHADVHSVANAYPVHASAFGVTDAELDARTIPESYLFLREVQKFRYGQQFTSPESIAGQMSLKQPVGILENDGVIVVGKSVLDTFDRLEVLETTAEAIINGSILGPIHRMSDQVIQELRSAFDPTVE
jgi:L-fuculose-phosphate aldolase